MTHQKSNIQMQKQIYYIWPHDFRWKNNALGQRIVMLSSLGKVKLIHRNGKRLPSHLNSDYEVITLGIDARHGDYLSLFTYFVNCIYYLFLETSFRKNHKNAIVYTNFEYSILIGIYAKKILRLRWIADFFDDPHRNLLNALHRRTSKWRCLMEDRFLKIYKLFLKSADLVICNSPNLEKGLGSILLKKFRLDENRVISVPNGVCWDYISDCINDTYFNNIVSMILEANNMSGKYIFFIGHINRYISGVYELLKAVKLLERENLVYHLVLAGICKAEEKKWLDNLIDELGMRSSVCYLGIIDQPLSYVLMKKASICVCPYHTKNRSDYETAYPVKLLEYLAVGAPTIVVKTSITKEIINDFGYGLMLSDCSVPDLMKGIKSIDRHNQTSVSSVPETYKWENINKKLLEWIKEKID